MKIKTSELTGAALDWAVAQIEGVGFYPNTDPEREYHYGYSPSQDWSQGGPIIEREELALNIADNKQWWAEKRVFTDGRNAYATSFDKAIFAKSPTPLISAMRCYVASKLGDEVDIPDELVVT